MHLQSKDKKMDHKKCYPCCLYTCYYNNINKNKHDLIPKNKEKHDIIRKRRYIFVGFFVLFYEFITYSMISSFLPLYVYQNYYLSLFQILLMFSIFQITQLIFTPLIYKILIKIDSLKSIAVGLFINCLMVILFGFVRLILQTGNIIPDKNNNRYTTSWIVIILITRFISSLSVLIVEMSTMMLISKHINKRLYSNLLIYIQFGMIFGLIFGPLITEFCHIVSNSDDIEVAYGIYGTIIVIISFSIFILVPKKQHNINGQNKNRSIKYKTSCNILYSFSTLITCITIILSLTILTFFYPILSIYVDKYIDNIEMLNVFALMAVFFMFFVILGMIHSSYFGSLKTICIGLIILMISLSLLSPFYLFESPFWVQNIGHEIDSKSNIIIYISFILISISMSFILIPSIYYLNYISNSNGNLLYNTYKFSFNIGCLIGPIIGVVTYNELNDWQNVLIVIFFIILLLLLIIFFGLTCLRYDWLPHPIWHIEFYPILIDTNRCFRKCSCYMSFGICCSYESSLDISQAKLDNKSNTHRDSKKLDPDALKSSNIDIYNSYTDLTPKCETPRNRGGGSDGSNGSNSSIHDQSISIIASLKKTFNFKKSWQKYGNKKPLHPAYENNIPNESPTKSGGTTGHGTIHQSFFGANIDFNDNDLDDDDKDAKLKRCDSALSDVNHKTVTNTHEIQDSHNDIDTIPINKDFKIYQQNYRQTPTPEANGYGISPPPNWQRRQKRGSISIPDDDNKDGMTGDRLEQLIHSNQNNTNDIDIKINGNNLDRKSVTKCANSLSLNDNIETKFEIKSAESSPLPTTKNVIIPVPGLSSKIPHYHDTSGWHHRKSSFNRYYNYGKKPRVTGQSFQSTTSMGTDDSHTRTFRLMSDSEDELTNEYSNYN